MSKPLYCKRAWFGEYDHTQDNRTESGLYLQKDDHNDINEYFKCALKVCGHLDHCNLSGVYNI